MKKLITSSFVVMALLVFVTAVSYADDVSNPSTGNGMEVVGTPYFDCNKGHFDSVTALSDIVSELMSSDHSLTYFASSGSTAYVFMPNYIVSIKHNDDYGCYGIYLENDQFSGWLHMGNGRTGYYMVHCSDTTYEPSALVQIINSLLSIHEDLVGSNASGGIRRYVDEIATVSWRINSALSDLSDTLTSVISNGKVLVDNSDVVSAIQSIPAFDDSDILAAIKSIPAFDDADIIKAIQAIPAFDDTNIVYAINSIPAFDASGIITTIRSTSDTVVTKLTSLLTTSDKILGAVNSGNSTLSSINSKLSTISGLLSQIVSSLGSGSSSGGTTVSVSASAISDPIVSAVDVLRVSLLRQLSETWYTDTTMDEYIIPARGMCYIPFAVGDYPDDGSWSSYSSDLYVIPGDVEISPDIIDSNFIPSDYGFGEEGFGWFTSSAFSVRGIYTNDYFSGVTVVNTSDSDIVLYVCSPDGDFTASLYTLGRTISGKLTLILNRIPTSSDSASAVDLTGVITGIDTVNANVTALNTSLNTNLDSLVDKLQIVVDNSTTNVENVTNVVIDESNNAYNVFYVTTDDGEKKSIGEVSGDALSASGKLLNFLYKLCFENALSKVDDSITNMDGFYFDDAAGLEGSIWD